MDQNKPSDEEVGFDSEQYLATNFDILDVDFIMDVDGSPQVKDDVAQDALTDRRVEAEQSFDSLSTVDENTILNANDDNFENRLRQRVDVLALTIHGQEDASTDRRVEASNNVDAEKDWLFASLLSVDEINDDDDEVSQYAADLHDFVTNQVEEELDIPERQPRPPRRPKRPALTLEEIQPHENKRLSDASEILGGMI